MKKHSLVCLNLGSGPIWCEGWLNIDWGLLPLLGSWGINRWLCKWGILGKDYDVKWPQIVLRDIRGILPYTNASVDYIYCSHVLEHFEKWETGKILKECRRVLKKGGVMRVVLPDIDIIRKISNADEFNQVMVGYDRNLFSGLMGKIKLLAIRPHRWMYNFKSFKKLLTGAGFVNVKKSSYRSGSIPGLKKLDLEIHQKLSFYVEASY